MNNKITYFDHDKDTKQYIKELLENSNGPSKDFTIYILPDEIENILIIDANVVEYVKGDHNVIVHIYTKEFKKLIEESKAGDMRLRVSTKGLMKKCYRTRKGVNCLFLRKPHDKLDVNEWHNVLNAITKETIVNQIIEGNIPPELKEYFGEEPKIEVTIALAILIQGYMLAYAFANQKFEGFPEPMKKVFEKMGLNKFCKNEIFMNKVSNKEDEVHGHNYWNIFGPDLYTSIEKEAKDLDIQDTDFTSVYKLAEKIDAGKSLDKADAPKLVAEAYLEIYKQQTGKVS